MARRPPTEPPPRPGSVDTRLTQEESTAISDLLRQVMDDEEDTVTGPAWGRGGGEPIVLRYDLVGGTTRHGDDLPGLQLVHERFATELGNELRRAVGDEGLIFAQPIEYTSFAELYARLSAPTVVLMANLEGIGCSALITLHPNLAMHFIDLLMGGEGGFVPLRDDLATRGLTMAEKGVLRHLVMVLSRALGTAWHDFANVGLELLRVVTDPRHAAIFEPNEAMADLVVRVEWGAVEGAIHMILPTSFLARFDAALSRTAAPESQLRTESVNVELMRDNLAPVVVSLSAILGTTEMTLEQLLALAPGDVLRLGADPGAPLTICVEGCPKMTGFPTVQRGNVAVKVVDFDADGS